MQFQHADLKKKSPPVGPECPDCQPSMFDLRRSQARVQTPNHALRITCQVGVNQNYSKAEELIRDLPCHSYETSQESKGKGLQLVKMKHFCPGAVHPHFEVG